MTRGPSRDGQFGGPSWPDQLTKDSLLNTGAFRPDRVTPAPSLPKIWFSPPRRRTRNRKLFTRARRSLAEAEAVADAVDKGVSHYDLKRAD